MAEIVDPESRVHHSLWGAQDYADIVARWAAGLPASQVHVVTVPQPGAPKSLLWQRFAEVLGVDGTNVSLDVPRDNTSLGLEQAVFLREVNLRLGDRVPMPGPWTDVGKILLAHRVLGARPGTPLVLGGADLELARQRSAEVVAQLRDRGVTVHGDLDELLVPDDLDRPPVSAAREPVADDVLLEEGLEVVADLLDAVAERLESHRVQRAALREDLQRARTELRVTKRRAGAPAGGPRAAPSGQGAPRRRPARAGGRRAGRPGPATPPAEGLVPGVQRRRDRRGRPHGHQRRQRPRRPLRRRAAQRL
jgi:hypothetical protein